MGKRERAQGEIARSTRPLCRWRRAGAGRGRQRRQELAPPRASERQAATRARFASASAHFEELYLAAMRAHVNFGDNLPRSWNKDVAFGSGFGEQRGE
jgi:hypothetical protein